MNQHPRVSLLSPGASLLPSPPAWLPCSGVGGAGYRTPTHSCLHVPLEGLPGLHWPRGGWDRAQRGGLDPGRGHGWTEGPSGDSCRLPGACVSDFEVVGGWEIREAFGEEVVSHLGLKDVAITAAGGEPGEDGSPGLRA